MKSDDSYLIFFLVILVGFGLVQFYTSLSAIESALLILIVGSIAFIIGVFLWDHYSTFGKARRKKLDFIRELPTSLLLKDSNSILMGTERDLEIPLFFPDAIRSRHIHIIGATGSGKTESVILNFLKQDVERGLGSIILDAKGDTFFIHQLNKWIPKKKLKIFDLVSDKSLTYDPLEVGSPLESAQRLFSSLTWSEEYYKSKALFALQKIFQSHFQKNERNPKLIEVLGYLENPNAYSDVTISESYPVKLAFKDFSELSGLRDQVRSLTIGNLARILSPTEKSQMNLETATSGSVLYFRLQSLMSPQIVSTLGKLLINHLNYLAGTAHRNSQNTITPIIPIYLDEFASFACLEFADLISKARSAGYALHFSHQSIGDLAEISKGFLNQITDNSATKIVMRINDPDSADFFARAFGTKLYQKITQRVTNAEEIDEAEIVGEGSQREAHQFRAAPDLFKTLPTGEGSVLMAHGCDTPHGASSVFRIKFPRLSN